MKRMIFNDQLTKEQFAAWLDNVQHLASKVELVCRPNSFWDEKERLEELSTSARELWYRIHDIAVDKTPPLKSLDQHNSEIAVLGQNTIDAMKPHPNGIACPKCNKELWDTDPWSTLATWPRGQKNIHCPACGYKGFRGE